MGIVDTVGTMGSGYHMLLQLCAQIFDSVYYVLVPHSIYTVPTVSTVYSTHSSYPQYLQ